MKRMRLGDRGLTPRQLEMLLLIIDCGRERQTITHRLLMRKLGVASPTLVIQMLEKLKRLGLIDFADNAGRQTPKATTHATCTLEIIDAR